MKFIRVKGSMYREDMLLALKRVPPTEGRDGISRCFVLSVDDKVTGSFDPKHREVWLTQKEAKAVLEYMKTTGEDLEKVEETK